jgi:hypothetical protein
MAEHNKLELVVEVDVNKANASIKSVNTGLSSMEQAASKAAHGASASIDGMTASMVKGAAAGTLAPRSTPSPSPAIPTAASSGCRTYFANWESSCGYWAFQRSFAAIGLTTTQFAGPELFWGIRKLLDSSLEVFRGLGCELVDVAIPDMDAWNRAGTAR